MKDDLISRQAVMKEFADFVKRSNNSDFAAIPTWNDAVSLVGSMPAAQQWIPCSERLPEDEKEVLVTNDDWCYIAEYDSFECQWYESVEYRRIYGVSTWMPLPEPYKQEEKNDSTRSYFM